MTVSTSASSDLICIPRDLKAALTEAKGRLTYGALLARLVEMVPVPTIAQRMREEASVWERRAQLLRALDASGIQGARRTATKQLLIARLAPAGWKRWIQSGRVERIGPRRYRWNVLPPAESRGVSIVRRLGRGLPPR